MNVLKEIVEAKNDATLSEIREQLKEHTGITIGISTVDRMLKKMEIRLKKRFFSTCYAKLSRSTLKNQGLSLRVERSEMKQPQEF